jgi:pimeloyl-ACP methyl ester carboxylesterase
MSPASLAFPAADPSGETLRPAGGDVASGPDESRTTSAPTAAPPPDGCPVPLAWREVIEVFRRESVPWTVSRAGREIRGRSWGAGRPLYVLGGWTGSCESFALLAWLLRDRFKCVFVEVEAAGRPLDRAAPYRSLADDLCAAADRLGDRRFSVLAVSCATPIALTAMRGSAERIQQAVLVGGFARHPLSFAERLLVRAGRWCPGTVAAVPGRRAIAWQNHRPWFPPHDAGRFEFLVEDAGRTPIRELAARAGLAARVDLRPCLAEIDRPELLLRTEGEGALVTAQQDELAAGLPRARSEWLHTTGRIPHLTHPHRVAKVVAGFLLEGDPPGN